MTRFFFCSEKKNLVDHKEFRWWLLNFVRLLIFHLITSLHLSGKDYVVFEVSGDDKRLVGTYVISHEVANGAPDCPVWELVGKEFYVFNNGSDEGWRIGTKQNLTDGFYLYKSKNWVLL